MYEKATTASVVRDGASMTVGLEKHIDQALLRA